MLSYSFDRIVLIFGYIVERTVLKFSRAIFFAISILNPNYDVINDIISGFAKVVVERCGFHHWIAQRISWGEVVAVFTARRYASAVLAVVVCPSVCLSVRLSVCLSQAGIVSKRQHIESRKQRRTVAQGI